MFNTKLFLTSLVFFSILIIFFIFFYQLHDHGLPFFINADEGASIKSLLFYYNMISGDHQKIYEPIYYSFFNFLVTGTIIFFKNLFFWNYSILEIKDYIYLNPDLLFRYGRISSLIFCLGSLVVFYLITLKLNFNKIYILFSTLSLSLSFLFFDISIVVGKNAILLFLFLFQFFFFIKFFKDIDNFKLRSYIFFSLLASISWGINYWAASVSIYAVIFLHFQKYKFNNLKYLFLFFLIFLVLGVFPNLIISEDNFIRHLINYDNNLNFDITRMVVKFLNEFKEGIKIILTIEKPILVILSILLFITYKREKNKKLVVFILILIIEPIIIFAFAEGAYPQLRYLGPSIFLTYILIGYLINNFKKLNSQYLVTLIIIISFAFFSIEKFKILKHAKKIINNKNIQYKVLEKYSSEKTLFFTSYSVYRENLKTLLMYEDLLNKKIIGLNPDADSKNSLSNINKKIQIINNAKKNKNYPNSLKTNFFGGEFEIKNYNKFVSFLNNNFDFIVINSDDKKTIDKIKNYYELEEEFNDRNLLNLRSITVMLEKKFNISNITEVSQIGLDISVYKKNFN